jgi:C4-dicarboxylate-specific signal transduction histidine kinase
MEKQLIQNHALASLGLLISSIAHETSNLNNCIIFNTPILRDYLEELVSLIDNYFEKNEAIEILGMPYPEFRKDVFKVLDTIEHASNRITETTYGLKDFVRTTSARKKIWIEVKEVIKRAVAICRGELRKMVKSFEVNVADNLSPIFIDPVAIEQILVNLLVNAAQAVDREDSRVMLNVEQGNTRQDRLIIEVSDNGCGMDEKTKEMIFEPFITTRVQDNGSGLGLFICQNLIEKMGGRIEVESSPGVGSTFRVFLLCEPRAK